MFIPSGLLMAQYPAIKVLNKDTVSIYNIENTKTLAKICIDRDYLIKYKDISDSIITNKDLIIYNKDLYIKNMYNIIGYKDSINNNLKSENGILYDIIDENEKVIKDKNTSLFIHKVIIVLTIAIAIFK